MLRSVGVKHIDTAATGEQAMEFCENHEYGLILCDYNLDESKDGQQILEELLYTQLLKYTTLFIIITAETSREMVLGAIENQPDDYITKPISQKLMRTRLDRALLKHEDLYKIKSTMDTLEYDKAVALCDEKIKTKNRYLWDCVRYKAQIFWMAGDVESAQKIYQTVIAEKGFTWAKLGLAKSMMKRNDFDNIESVLQEVLDRDHRYIEAHDLLSEYYEKTEQPVKAQEATEKATELSPKSITGHLRLAQLAEVNDDSDVCLKAYEESIRWNYNSCHASAADYLSVARKTVEVTKGKTTREAIDKTKKALGLLERMTRRFPERSNEVKSGFIESQLYANQGKDNYARVALQMVQEDYDLLNPKDVDSRIDYAQAQIMNGDKQQAYKELHLLSKDYKDNTAVQKRIDRVSDEPISMAGKACAADLSKEGINAYQEKDYDKAITIFNDALTMFPNHVGVNLNLVQVVLAKNEVDGKGESFYKICKDCFERVHGIDASHKKYSRYQFLHEQFLNEYSGYGDD